MANRIKGITVEINGDTTKLTDALKNVNRTISSTQSQLKDVEKLLKLDPTNTELLAQKQSLLTNAVSATSEKLDALRSAAQQAYTQLQDGRITQQQFDALQREIIDTEQSLRDYQRQLEELSDSSDDLDEALNDTADGADDADDSMKSLNKTADKTEGAFSIAKGAVATFVGNALTSLVDTAVDTAQTIGELSDSTMEFRENLAKLQTTAESAGYSTEYASGAFSEMYGVLGDETAATTTISNFMKLETSTDNLNNLLNSATGIWAVYGDSIPLDGLAESVNETAKVGQITGNLADALNWAGMSEDSFNESLAACTSEQERQQLIVDTLNSLYGESADKYRENNASIIAAREANLAYEESLAAIGGAMEPLNTQLTNLKAQLLSSLIPGIQQLCAAFQNLFSGVAGAAGQQHLHFRKNSVK